MRARAAQFAPFAALSGHDAAIRETARLTDTFHEPSDEERERLNARHRILMAHLAERPLVRVTWFEADAHKEGGYWVTRDCRIVHVDEVCRHLVLHDATRIPMDFVRAMDGAIFTDETGV